MATQYPAQLQSFTVAGSGQVIGDTQMTFTSMTDISGNPLLMTSLGTICYMTLEPNTVNEEQIQFTGITQNSNGTATITGVSSVGFLTPYTVTSGFSKSHAGGVSAIISNTSAFYSNFASVGNPETVTALWNFTTSPTVPTGGTGTQAANNQDIANAISGASGTATNTTFGTVKLSVAAVSPLNPIVVGDNDSRVPTANQTAALAGQSGTGMSAANKAEDFNDTSATSSANKLVRANGSGLIDNGFISFSPSLTMVAAQNITAGQAVYSTGYQSDGGIKYDTKANTTWSATTAASISVTVGNNSNRILLLAIQTNAAIGTPTVTFNSVAMTASASNTSGSASNTYVYTYYLIAPTVGTFNVTITGMNSNTGGAIAYSYYNVAQTGQPEVTNGTSSGTTTVTASITPVSQGDLIFTAVGWNANGAGGTLSSSSGLPNNQTFLTTASAAINYFVTGDSGVVLQALSQSISAQLSTTANAGEGVQLALKPFTAMQYAVAPTSASAASTSTTFIGFAQSSITQGNSGSITVYGVVTGLSGLNPQSTYYLSNSSGAISTTAGSTTRKVGIAVSNTQLLLTNVW